MNWKARRYGDQMICDRCGLSWDINDPDPPKCLDKQQYGLKMIEQLRKLLSKSC